MGQKTGLEESMKASDNEVELMDYLSVIWKRRGLIIVSTVILVALAVLASFLLPKTWEIDAIIVPSKFMVQTEQGEFIEVVVTEPRQIAGQINQESYNNQIADDLALDIRKFPKLHAENLRDTKLIRIWIRDKDISKAKSILNHLFVLIKADLDKKIEVEIKDIDTRIANNENLVKQKEIDIQSAQIEITRTNQEIAGAKSKLKISEERLDKIVEEMKSVKERVAEIEKTLRGALAEKKEGTEALGLLLYSNEIQQNMRYYDTLDEKLSAEKLIQENLRLDIKGKGQDIKELGNQISKFKNEIEIIKKDNEFLAERKLRIDFARLIKAPTSSLNPVFPKKTMFAAISVILGLFLFTLLAFFLEYIQKSKRNESR
jgi:capsular polysaccharide biosynthesis protein